MTRNQVLVWAAVLVSAMVLPAPMVLCAQERIDPPPYEQPRSSDIVLGGNEMRRSVTCQNNAVYVQGQENQVEVRGSCTFVRVQGNRNVVMVDHATTVPVEGNENTIYFADPKTRISERGERNRFEHRKAGSPPLD